ncbi:putative metal-dependent phosphoesterase, PHP family [Halobacteroides halobius DSM 5150]|uniref:Putative metal-dependent phosphoesterase, PHP family n=1 Tax=Halobacteroides halobius (strain ATCC 35273 / DSM 5150 / MD-1) TaxID=748449 RepID=L0KCP3_HALHC|nr:PHP domain-containing protein [Halobacteroides halobius]AGB41833.1 putative metal-dependent phosphoesterase, PHP family [Halobacteroides halobius DSM 5150]
MKEIDLHIHTNYSDDADYSVQEIIKKAKEKKLAAIAITDHNVTDGVDEALELTRGEDLEIIPGVEFDTRYRDNTLHILGYYLDWKSPKIDKLLAGMEEAKKEQFYKRIARLQELGFNITAQEVLAQTDHERPLGGFIAEVLLSKPENQGNDKLQTYLKGDKSDQPYFNFYLDYFKAGAKAYVPCWKPQAKDAIELIRQLGGVAILAHPGSTLSYNDKEVIDDLITAGLQGLESYSTYHDQEEIEGFVKLAKQKEILSTAGSDFHGHLKPKIELGNVAGNSYRIVKELKKLRGDRDE